MLPSDIYFNAFHKGNFIQRFWQRYKFDEVVNVIDPKNLIILDIGCGPAIMFSLLPDSAFCVGIDISKDQIKFAKKSTNRYFVVGNSKNLPFTDNTFDYITLIEVLEHLDKDKTVEILSEINRLLKKDGSLIITTPNYHSLWPIIERIWSKINPVDYTKEHINKMTIRRIRELLERSNFKNIKIKTIFIISPFLAFLPYKIIKKLCKIETKILPNLGSLIFIKADK